MKKTLATILVIATLLPAAGAEAEDYGGYGGAYLQLSVHPRATGMGSAYTAVADDPAGLFLNPGATAQLTRFSFGGAYRSLSMDRSLQQIAIVFPVRGEAALGLSAEMASMSGIEGRNRLGEATGELDNLDAVMSVTFARRFSHVFSLGFNARYYYKKLESATAYSAGFDIGGLVHLDKTTVIPETMPLDLLRLSAVVRNISAKYPWNTGDYWAERGLLGTDVDDEVPLAVLVGASALMLESRLLLAVDAEKTEHKSVKLYVGGELQPYKYVALRSGLAQGRPAFGLGVLVPISRSDMRIDIAVEKAQNVGGWETIVGTSWQF